MLENKIDVNSIKINSKYVNILGTPEQIHDFIRNNDTNKKKIFCFDLDNTLVTYPQIIGDYTTVLPIYANIKFLRLLYDQGHKILIYTARRMRTYKSNISLVKKNIKKLTIFQLKNFKIPYHKLIFGKPYANYYIDDLSINAHENLPFALGYNYEKITSRDFNKVTIGENYTLKSSNKIKKIKNEINYYKKLPIQIRNYFPSVVGSGKNYYKLETIKGVSYSYLYINEILLDKDLDLLIKVLSKIHNLKVNKTFFKQNIYKNYYVKFNQRLKIIDLKLVNHFKKHINRIKNFLENYENEKEGKLGIVHGDTVFSNIFKTTNNTLKLIDPRAGQLNTFSMHGDIFYDYAKIYQSLTGFEEIFSYKSVNKLFFIEKKKYFENLIKDLYGEKALKNIKYLTSSLIISLIPMQDKKKSYQFLELSKNIFMLNSKKKNIVIIITKSYFSDYFIKKIKKSKLKNDYNFIFYYSLQKFTLKRFIINIAILNLFDFIEIIFNYIKKIFIKIRYTDNIREIKNINDIFFIKKLLSLKPSIVVSLLCCQIFKKNFLDNINCPIVNFHPGLLPNYRGLYPNFFSIINKEKKIGFTCHMIDKKIDHGKILSRINV